MKPLLLAVALFFAFGPGLSRAGDPPPAPPPTPALEGRWYHYLKIHNGTEYPEGPGYTLRMFYEFGPNGESRLWWWHEGEADHCARRGQYRVEGDEIVDTTIWLDPTNTRDCSQDPDMQLGRTAHVRYHFRGPDLALHIPFGESEILFVWKRQTKGE